MFNWLNKDKTIYSVFKQYCDIPLFIRGTPEYAREIKNIQDKCENGKSVAVFVNKKLMKVSMENGKLKMTTIEGEVKNV